MCWKFQLGVNWKVIGISIQRLFSTWGFKSGVEWFVFSVEIDLNGFFQRRKLIFNFNFLCLFLSFPSPGFRTGFWFPHFHSPFSIFSFSFPIFHFLLYISISLLFLFTLQIAMEFKSTFPWFIHVLHAARWCCWCINQYFSWTNSRSWFKATHSICWWGDQWTLLLYGSWCCSNWLERITTSHRHIQTIA